MGNQTRGYRNILKETIRTLERIDVDYMIVGGIAVDYYGLPCPTIDLDILVKLEKHNIRQAVKEFRKSGFKLNEKEIRLVLEIGNRFVMIRPPSLYRVDIWLSKTRFDRFSLQRRRQGKIGGKKTWLISPEDLVLSKLRKGREQDLEDALGILLRQKGRLDQRYLSHKAKVLGVQKILTKVRGRKP
ncbi:MAG TPA: hypothetical protein ENH97_02870 [bacterium]|nr:hypothetical protein [bacterium]